MMPAGSGANAVDVPRGPKPSADIMRKHDEAGDKNEIDSIFCEVCDGEIRTTDVRKPGLTVEEYAKEPHVVVNRMGHDGYSVSIRCRHASCDAGVVPSWQFTEEFHRNVIWPIDRHTLPTCRMCGYNTPDFRKFTAHMESEHGITVAERTPEKTSETRTVRRCRKCGLRLGREVELPEGFAVLCAACIRLVGKGLPDAPFGIAHECECGDTLDEHEYVEDESDAPSPCNECGCEDWREKKKEEP